MTDETFINGLTEIEEYEQRGQTDDCDWATATLTYAGDSLHR